MIQRRDVTEPQGLFHPGRAYSYASIAYMLNTIEKTEYLPGWLAGRDLPFAVTGPQLSQVAAMIGVLLATVVSQVSLSLATLSYMPGTATALVLVLPAALWLYRHMTLVDPARLIGAGAGVLAMVPLTWAALALAAQV